VRFRADRDLILTTDMPGFYADPAADTHGRVTKAGFDLTAPVGEPDSIEFRRAYAPAATGDAPQFRTVVAALDAGPKHFGQIVTALGSTDGREIALELDILRERGVLTRLPNGEWRSRIGQALRRSHRV